MVRQSTSVICSSDTVRTASIRDRGAAKAMPPGRSMNGNPVVILLELLWQAVLDASHKDI